MVEVVVLAWGLEAQQLQEEMLLDMDLLAVVVGHSLLQWEYLALDWQVALVLKVFCL
ncbi:hypothetical protein GCM10011328_06200 [Hafnia psychrotolerans]|uniref:Uncharacterized protein n=1 Tax=Hafnia psychrotolerans TaxID=1477018 RepID=A0ABQ1FZ63_9GAMM|nr:hypothetical protein GCM10011328_06200 [Hafnia psychrotolerans]